MGCHLPYMPPTPPPPTPLQVEHRYTEGQAYAELSYKTSPDDEEWTKRVVEDLDGIEQAVEEVGGWGGCRGDEVRV